ncbi:MAG: hypothetical protein ABNH16_14875 [Thalassolituus sp.]|jgi:hypothetical protein
MVKTVMIIDLKELTNTSGMNLLSGRDNGVKARSMFGLNGSTLDPDTIIKVIDDSSTVISNSYFLGLLEGVFKTHSSKSSLLEHIDYSELSPTNQKELIRGINRGYSPSVSSLV